MSVNGTGEHGKEALKETFTACLSRSLAELQARLVAAHQRELELQKAQLQQQQQKLPPLPPPLPPPPLKQNAGLTERSDETDIDPSGGQKHFQEAQAAPVSVPMQARFFPPEDRTPRPQERFVTRQTSPGGLRRGPPHGGSRVSLGSTNGVAVDVPVVHRSSSPFLQRNQAAGEGGPMRPAALPPSRQHSRQDSFRGSSVASMSQSMPGSSMVMMEIGGSRHSTSSRRTVSLAVPDEGVPSPGEEDSLTSSDGTGGLNLNTQQLRWRELVRVIIEGQRQGRAGQQMFFLRPIWREENDPMLRSTVGTSRRGMERQGTGKITGRVASPGGNSRRRIEVSQMCVMRLLGPLLVENSWQRHVWGTLRLLLMMHYVYWSPVAWFNVGAWWLESTELLCCLALFWTLDTTVTILIIKKQRQSNDRESKRRLEVRWLEQSFLPQVVYPLCAVLDWVCVLISILGAREDRFVASAATFRTIRILQSLHLIKIRAFVFQLEYSTSSVITLLYIGIIRHVFFLVCLVHVLACAWYTLGESYGDGWLHQETTRPTDDYFYLSSLHWALSQVHGSMDIVPVTARERLFASAALLGALVGNSFFVASVTSMLMQIRSLNQERSRRHQTLRAFLRDHGGVTPELTYRMAKYIDTSGQLERIKANEADLRHILAEELQLELYTQLRLPTITQHPFFEELSDMFPRATSKMCYVAFETSIHLDGDTVFEEGEPAKRMYFVKSGEFEYGMPLTSHTQEVSVNWLSQSSRHTGSTNALERARPDDEDSPSEEMPSIPPLEHINSGGSMASKASSQPPPQPRRASQLGDGLSPRHGDDAPSKRERRLSDSDPNEPVSRKSQRSNITTESSGELPQEFVKPVKIEPDDWVAEAALWMPWHHMGDFTSVCEEGTIFQLRADMFESMLTANPERHYTAVLYAKGFASKMSAWSGTDILREPSATNPASAWRLFLRA